MKGENVTVQKIKTALTRFEEDKGKSPRLIRVTADDFVALQHEGAWGPSENPSLNQIPVEWSEHVKPGNINFII